jgi:hypothetical protein
MKRTGWAARRDHYNIPVLFNPYTGEPRDVRDVQTDPQGILIRPPGADLVADTPAERKHQDQSAAGAVQRPVGESPSDAEIAATAPAWWKGEPDPELMDAVDNAIDLLDLESMEQPAVRAALKDLLRQRIKAIARCQSPRPTDRRTASPEAPEPDEPEESDEEFARQIEAFDNEGRSGGQDAKDAALRELKKRILDLPCPTGEPPTCEAILALIDAAIHTQGTEG